MNMVSDVHKLWFPVKLGPLGGPGGSHSAVRRRVCLALLLSVVLGCGYGPAYGGKRPEARLSVVLSPARAPEAGAMMAIADGLRGELSRQGVLRPGTSYPRVVVELVRVDERSAGQRAVTNHSGVGGDALAVSRASLVGVTARAWIEEGPHQRPIRDTGDVRRTAMQATGSGLIEVDRRETALRIAGQAVGAALGRRVVGEVEPKDEPM